MQLPESKNSRRAKKIFIRTHALYFEKISNYIKYRINDQEIAKECSQEVFMNYWLYLSKGKLIRNKKQFLYAIAHNAVIDYYRTKKIPETSIYSISEENFQSEAVQEKEVDNKIEMNKVKKYLSEMEEQYKTMITYRYLEQMSIEEICRTTGKSPNYISVLIHKGLKILENKIKRADLSA